MCDPGAKSGIAGSSVKAFTYTQKFNVRTWGPPSSFSPITLHHTSNITLLTSSKMVSTLLWWQGFKLPHTFQRYPYTHNEIWRFALIQEYQALFEPVLSRVERRVPIWECIHKNPTELCLLSYHQVVNKSFINLDICTYTAWRAFL